MRNEMNTNKMMKSCRSALSMLSGVDNRTMAQVAEMNMRSRNADAETREDVMSNLFGERSAASEDFSF